MPLAPLEWSSATDDNQHMKNPDINVAEIATESTDEKIKQSLTVDNIGCRAGSPCPHNIGVLMPEECTCGSYESKKRAFLTQHLNQAHNIRRWVVTLSPFVRLHSTQGSMTPCDLIFERTAFRRNPNTQGG